MLKANELRDRRKQRTRSRLRKVGGARPRLSVFRSNKNIYAQIIDDGDGRTIAAASSLDKDIRAAVKSGSTADAAKAVGKLIAERAMAGGLAEVVFDRGAYMYHGRVRALAESAREAGLKF